MPPDLLIKLIAVPTVPVMLSLVFLTDAETDQYLTESVTSGQYGAAQDVEKITNEELSYNNTSKGKNDLKANPNSGLGYASRVSYFDYAEGIDLAKEQLITQLDQGEGHQLSIANPSTSYGEGTDGDVDLLLAGKTGIDAESYFFENAFGGEEHTKAASYFSSLSGINNMTDGSISKLLSCQPYSQLQKNQSQLNSELSNNSVLGSLGKKSGAGTKLAEQKNLNAILPLGEAQSSELGVGNLLDAVTTTQHVPAAEMAIAQTETLDQCFIVQAKTALDLVERIAIAPTEQMPDLSYYNYFSSTAKTKIDINDGSASYFLFQKTEESPEEIEKRRRLYQTARQAVSKWNAF